MFGMAVAAVSTAMVRTAAAMKSPRLSPYTCGLTLGTVIGSGLLLEQAPLLSRNEALKREILAAGHAQATVGCGLGREPGPV